MAFVAIPPGSRYDPGLRESQVIDNKEAINVFYMTIGNHSPRRRLAEVEFGFVTAGSVSISELYGGTGGFPRVNLGLTRSWGWPILARTHLRESRLYHGWPGSFRKDECDGPHFGRQHLLAHALKRLVATGPGTQLRLVANMPTLRKGRLPRINPCQKLTR